MRVGYEAAAAERMARTVGGLVVDPAELGRLYERRTAATAPAYQRVKDLVVRQIADGHWRADDALPSESQFVEALGLSRMTVNRALRELAGEGVIRRVMGVGSFVAPAKASSALLEVHNIAEEVGRRGHRYEARVLAVREERADEKTGAHLGLGEG